MQLSQEAIDAGIGAITLEIIDEAPRYELTAPNLMDLRKLRHVANKEALKAIAGDVPVKAIHSRDGYYINGEQAIGYSDVSGPGPYTQILALHYLEGVA